MKIRLISMNVNPSILIDKGLSLLHTYIPNSRGPSGSKRKIKPDLELIGSSLGIK